MGLELGCGFTAFAPASLVEVLDDDRHCIRGAPARIADGLGHQLDGLRLGGVVPALPPLDLY